MNSVRVSYWVGEVAAVVVIIYGDDIVGESCIQYSQIYLLLTFRNTIFYLKVYK